MITSFFHDHQVLFDISGHYSPGQFSIELWKRYLHFSDELNVVCRGRYEKLTEDIKSNTNKLDIEGVDIRVLTPKSNNFISYGKDERAIIYSTVFNSDIIICRLPSEIGAIAHKYALSLGKKVIIEVVGCPFDSFRYQGSLLGKVYSVFWYFRMKKHLMSSMHSIYVSSEFLPNRYPTQVNSNVAYVSDVVIDRTNYNKSKITPNKIGLIASLNTDYKGIDTAIKALSFADNLLLEIVGPGSPDKWISLARAEGVEERVTFLGSLPSGDSINSWLDTVDIYIQPSLTEGLPRALVEAMSRGKVCLGSRVGGIPELLSPEFMFSKRDYKSLARLLLKYSNIADKDEIAKRNLEFASEFVSNLITSKRNDFYQKVLDCEDNYT
ncbi:hypothetical protein BCT63_20590 [Vibrio kanaloae]|uniref:glycosyltransferase n=1 Tax=Vibrio kanaloae TaxID=170673 RepID=UPI000C82BF4C|nr:glycosyltransferase [Vibrio kanaloae]PML99405.1 hypothetical protein BCT63_20590 [Vibrio kanaloae]